MRRALPILWILIAAGARAQDSANAAAPESDVLVVSAARLITGTGADLTDARVVISNGKITAVGPAAETAAPEGARLIETDVLAPAFLDAGNLGLLDGASVSAGPTGAGDRVVDMVDAWNQHARLSLLRAGVAGVYLDLPPFGRLMRGPTGAVGLVTPEDPSLQILDDAAGVTFRVGGSSNGAATVITRSASLRNLKAAFSAAERRRKALKKYEEERAKYEKALKEWEEKQKKGAAKSKEGSSKEKPDPEKKKAEKKPQPPEVPAPDPAGQAMLRIMDGEAPLRVDAHWKEDILAVLAVAKEHKARCVLLGASEAWRCLDEIKEAGASVVLGPSLRLGGNRIDWYRMRPDLAKLLHDHGVPFAFMTAGAHGYRHDCAPLLAALAVAHGLPEDAALKALTAGAAGILGMEERLGSVEVGKDAVLQLIGGDPLDPDVVRDRMVVGVRVVEIPGRNP